MGESKIGDNDRTQYKKLFYILEYYKINKINLRHIIFHRYYEKDGTQTPWWMMIDRSDAQCLNNKLSNYSKIF